MGCDAVPPDRQVIIAEAVTRRRGRRPFWIVLAATLAVGVAASVYYADAQLTLSHYDARAHLVVARRILDSLTPGWRQVGAVWLPLPHVLNALPAQWDWAYRTGAIATAFSVLAMAAGLAALGALVARRTGSLAAGLAAALVVQLNPNVLYLQSTPMTEPLLFGLALLALAATDGWIAEPSAPRRRAAGWLIVALMLTRYEGWFIGGGLAVLAVLARWRRGGRLRDSAALLPYPIAAVLAFFVLSKATVGAWFVTGGFYDATNPSAGRPLAAAEEVLTAAAELAGWPIVLAGAAGALLCLLAERRRPGAALPVALVFAAALPFIAFQAGHPHRVRYMVPLVVAAGALAGFAVGALPRRVRTAAALALLASAVWSRGPLDARAPMLIEAQWETPGRLAREPITTYLRQHWDDTPIFASMGSLAHYMQEASAIGLGIQDFLHEGNAYLWEAALAAPGRHVRWMLIEEQVEGGDQLAARARTDPAFLAGFRRVAEGGGVALYARDAAARASESNQEPDVERAAAEIDFVAEKALVEAARVP
jgi:hypothetical protein